MRRSVEIRIRVGDGDGDRVVLCLGFAMWRVPDDATISLSSTLCTRCDLSDLSAVLNEILLVFFLFILTYLFGLNALFPLLIPTVLLIGCPPFPIHLQDVYVHSNFVLLLVSGCEFCTCLWLLKRGY